MLVELVQNMPVVAVQSVDPHLQSTPAVLVVAPSVMEQLVGGRIEQVLVEVVQYNPLVAVQSEVPHEQGAELIETPFVMVHCASFLQELMDAVQNIPVVAVQSVVPHLQLSMLAAAPLVIPHGQVMSSLAALVTYVPVGQVPHEAASEKETSGLDMYFPAGQQPGRALLPLLKTFDKVDHFPPHNVRLNPLE